MHILYLSPDVRKYNAAFYQRDVWERLQSQHTVSNYGPGFEIYDPSDTLVDILTKLGTEPDIICIGHSWLSNDPTVDLDPHPNLDLSETSIPTAMIINKEYVKFDQKVAYAEDQDISLIFTHHHYADKWDQEYEPEFIFWPFAVNSDRFHDYGEERKYDFAFSGILRNPDPDVPQTNLRQRVQDELFHTVGELKIKLKQQYADYDIFWRARPTSKYLAKVNAILHHERRLPDDEYKRLYNRSKLSLNTLSPIQLVGTRYYEAMASKSLVFCQSSHIYSEYNLFEPGKHCITFSNDMSDFEELFKYMLRNDEERAEIAARGHRHVMNNHTWDHRIETFTEIVRSRLL